MSEKQSTDMSREGALEIVIDAALSWADELGEYVIPGADESEVEGYQNSLDEINAACGLLRHEKGTPGEYSVSDTDDGHWVS